MEELKEILKNIKAGNVAPVYIIQSQENFYIDQADDFFCKYIIPEEEKSFCETILYAKDTSIPEVIGFARQMPMFGERQLIVVRESQNFTMNEDLANQIAQYADNPLDSTTLVFFAKDNWLNTKLKYIKGLSQKVKFLEIAKLRDYQMPKWFADRSKFLGVQLNHDVPALLSDFLGTDLARGNAELIKLKNALPKGHSVTGKDIEYYIGISNQFNIFELKKCLAMRNIERSMMIAKVMVDGMKPGDFPPKIAVLSTFFIQIMMVHGQANDNDTTLASNLGLRSFAIPELRMAARNFPMKVCSKVISEIRDIMAKSRGDGAISQNPEDLFIELIYRILNAHLL